MAFFANYAISEADKLAYQIHAVAYSMIYQNPSPAQQYIGQPCTAAVSCNGSLYIAGNDIWRTVGPGAYMAAENWANVGNLNANNAICALLRGDGIAAPIHFLANPLGEGDTSYHAELQLYDFIYRLHGLAFDGPSIGVSKPCCQVCANSMHNAGIGFTDYHNNPTNAASPYPGQVPYIFYSCP